MMDPRLQQRQHRQSQLLRPPYPQAAAPSHSSPSATSSVFQSTSSLASISSINSDTSMLQPSQQAAFGSAPLPSPSGQQPMGYFNPMMQSQQGPSSYSNMQQRLPQQAQQGTSSPFVGQRGVTGGAPETVPFLQDFNLVAEAAKRAQMACLERDLGEVGL